MKIVKPKKLKKGDVIGLIAPSSPITDKELLNNSIGYIEKQGYSVELGKNIYLEKGYLAGDDTKRLEDLHNMFSNKNIKAIICIRGGYGSTRILDRIDYNLIKKNPKIFVGYSDITALSLAFLNKTGLVTLAGPMPLKSLNEEITPFTEEIFWKTLTSDKKIGFIKNPNEENFFVLQKGKAEAPLVGGNLSVLTSLLGTPFFPKMKDNLLLLEETCEPPYRVDRMLSQLKNAGIFNEIKGVVLGRFINCVETNLTNKSLTINDVIADYFESMKIPVIYNVNHGHVPETISIPIGLSCTINTVSGATIKINDSLVES